MRGRGVVAVAEEGKLGLSLVRGEFGVLALAVEERGGRGGVTGFDGEDAVFGGVVRTDGEDELARVVGEEELGGFGEGAVRGGGEVAQDEVAAELGGRGAAGSLRQARREAPCRRGRSA